MLPYSPLSRCGRAALVFALAAGAAAALFRPVCVRAEDPPKVIVRKDLAYYEGPGADEKRHKLDLYLPEGKQNFPILIFIHGGAWRSGVKDLYGPLGETIVKQGIGVVVPNYRLSPAVQHPEHIRDVARAFAWVEKHAKEWGGDPKRLYVSGHSAGGHLVTLLALDPKYLQAEGTSVASIRGVVGISGPYSLPGNLFPEVFGTDEAKRPDAFPLNHVDGQDGAKLPPFLLLYADQDYPGLPLSAQSLQAALEKAHAKVTSHEITMRDHITIISSVRNGGDPVEKYVVEFVNGMGEKRE